MAKYDEEQFMRDLKNIVLNNVNAKIDEINTEKGDNLLKQVDDNNFYLTLDDQYLNADPIIYYGIAGSESLGIGPSTERKVGVFFDIIFINDFTDRELIYKCLRYSRALREVIECNFKKIAEVGNLVIETVTPTDVKMHGEGPYYKIGGVVVSGNLWS